MSNSGDELFSKGKGGPVECLGMTFENDDARREYFTQKLKEKLTDPEFRKIPGFPKGSDEDILRMSDPPYYTACPNPFLQDFVRIHGKPFDPGESYEREPFAGDVSEGKNDAIYNAHTYHTKVPHKAIMRYLLHYTEPGDLVFDGFCGTGMTGVAARLCGNRRTVSELGYHVTSSGKVKEHNGSEVSLLGARNSILLDLSPLASFVASNYGQMGSHHAFINEANSAIDKVEKELDWLYEGPKGGRVSNAVWSDIFLCPHCSHEVVYYHAAMRDGKLQRSFPCPFCDGIVGKAASQKTGASKLERSFTTVLDPALGKVVKYAKLVLVEETTKSRGSKQVARYDTRNRSDELNRDLANRVWPPVPLDEFFTGRQTNKLINGSGISFVAHMYTSRALFAYASLWQVELSTHRHTSMFRFCLSAINNYVSRKQGYFGGGGGVSGTLFTPSVHHERNVFDVLRRKIKKIKALELGKRSPSCTSTQSIAHLHNLPDASVDYIFTDPPFGESLQYAELNMFAESWMRVRTKTEQDCVLNYVHKKDLAFYSSMMSAALREYARVLKPGRWITVEFHNSQNAVWSAIQQAIEAAGLVVADVRVLDKQQRSFNAVNRAGAVDQDLIISAYRPEDDLERKFELAAGSEDGVWNFTRSHLRQLPVFVSNENLVEVVTERQSFLLFDRMVAFHVQRGVTVPVSASEFYSGLAQRFPERDGMYFLPEQVAEYDKKRTTVKAVRQLELFVNDEASAVMWLRTTLKNRPMSYQDLSPIFMKKLQSWSKHERTMELSTLLEQNFICYDGTGPVPGQIHSYLSTNFKELRNLDKGDPVLVAKAKDRWYVPEPGRQADVEKLRHRALLKEFEEYKETRQRKLKLFRTEAVRAGFKAAYDSDDYRTIVAVAAKLPDKVLQEDEKLLMYYDVASTRLGED